MFDFPSSPAIGAVSNGYTFDGVGWGGGPGVSGPVTEQYIPVAGFGSYDIAVPAWAKACRIDGFTYVTVSAYIGLRVSTDGTTFSAGASDYYWGGPVHNSGSLGYTSAAPFAFHCLALTQSGDNPSIVQSFTVEMDVVRPTTAFVLSCRSYAKSLDSGATTGYRTWHGFGYVVGTTLGSALALKSIRIFPSAGLFGPGSFIRVKWIGDSAAIPQSNAIADAPNDAYQYLRGQNAWNSGGTMSGDLTISKAVPRINLSKSVVAQDTPLYGALNGVARWALNLATSETESGSNAGSNFAIMRFSDAGSWLGNEIVINRATGVVTATGLAPTPTMAAGRGEFKSLTGGVGAAVYLPAGGTWAWYGFVVTASGTVWPGFYSGTNAGGTMVTAGSPNTQFCLVVWRLT